jgi:tetratricopeptide (TPR) repeat protein
MADPLVGGARAAFGQGLGMGWGDEAEAWLRSKLGNESYEDNLKKIRSEYGEFSQQYPITTGTAEFAGGAAPGVAMMMYPPAIPAGAAQVSGAMARTAARIPAWAKLAGAGGTTGAISGAGSAEEGQRGSGAFTGGVMGTTLGLAVPMAVRGTKGASSWLRERLFPTDALVERKAAEKMAQAMAEDKLTTAQIQAKMAQDKAIGVPSVVANTNPALADLAEAVAQRTGAGARKIEKTLMEQKLGSRERAHQQTVKALKPGDYYDDLTKLQEEMKTLAGPAYQQAYSYGEVADPKVLKYMELPQFQQALKEADKLLKAEGRELDLSKPTVEVLDQVKRGLDSLIEGQTDAITGKTTSLGRVYTQKKNEFLKDLDKAVPDYELARGIYAGGAELSDAMRKGINEFGRMDHEQVIKLVSGMGESEKHAFRTGVARDLYDKIMKPSGNFNAAQRLIGSPEMQAKLQPLFDNPAQFELFKNALEREAQLFNQSSKILGGSPTGKRMQMRESLEDGSGIGDAMMGAITGGWKSSLANAVVSGLRKGQMTEKTSAKLADMLMSKDPHEVAAVVKMLDEQAAAAIPKAARASAVEGAGTTGTATAIFPSPEGSAPQADMEKDVQLESEAAPISGPDIEADIEADIKKEVK